jgi:hypothetical protein
MGGDDPEHQLSDKQKDKRERELRELAKQLLRQNKSKEANKLLRRARNISREPSKHAQHH